MNEVFELVDEEVEIMNEEYRLSEKQDGPFTIVLMI